MNFMSTVSYSLVEFSSNILKFAENDQFHQSPLPIPVHEMVGPRQTIIFTQRDELQIKSVTLTVNF